MVRVVGNEVARPRAEPDIAAVAAQHASEGGVVGLTARGRHVHTLSRGRTAVVNEDIGEAVPVLTNEIRGVRTKRDDTSARVDRRGLTPIRRLADLTRTDASRPKVCEVDHEHVE